MQQKESKWFNKGRLSRQIKGEQCSSRFSGKSSCAQGSYSQGENKWKDKKRKQTSALLCQRPSKQSCSAPCAQLNWANGVEPPSKATCPALVPTAEQAQDAQHETGALSYSTSDKLNSSTYKHHGKLRQSTRQHNQAVPMFSTMASSGASNSSVVHKRSCKPYASSVLSSNKSHAPTPNIHICHHTFALLH